MWKLLRRTLSRIRGYVFLFRPLDFYGLLDVPQTMLQPACPLEIREGSSQELGLIVDLQKDIDKVVARKRVEYLFANGGKPFLAFSQGKLTHVSWLFYHPGIRENYFTVKLKEGEGYIGTCYTSPEFRGKNIYPVIIQHIVRYAAAENKKRCFISSGPKNLASIKGVEKAGFTRIGRLRVFKLFGKMFNDQWASSNVSGSI